MRFAAVHKTCTYLVALCAFASVALSGELDGGTMLVGLVGLVGSWWFEPPRVRVERFAAPLTIVALGSFAFTVLTWLSGTHPILAGARFLTVLLVVKLLSRRASKDYQQVYLLSFLLLTTGTAMNTGISFAVCFLGFVVAATWALILFHLRREMEDNFLLKHADDASSEKVQVERILSSRRIVGPSFLASTSLVSLATFIGAIALFILFPRVGFGLFFQKSRAGVSVAGFSDRVQLGGHGTIRDDDTVVMRVYLDQPLYRGADAPALHFRGVAFDNYQKGLWSRSLAIRPTGKPRRSMGAVTLFVDGPRTDVPPLGDRLALGLRQDIYVEPLETNVLFGASTPLRFEVSPRGVGARQRQVAPFGGDEVRFDRDEALRYTVVSDPTPPPRELLQAARDVDPDDLTFVPYLQIPSEMPERVRRLAHDITAGATTPFEKTVAVHAYLQSSYSYTLEQETDERYEPLDYFLFERKKGHCEYFSSAMAILLREVGVPTRNVNGFLGGEWNEYGGYLAVRGGDAHSWVEVWFDGVGWVTFDPTPSATLDRKTGFLDKIRRFFDTMKLRWFKWVIEYDLQKQLGVFKKIGSALSLGGGGKLSAKAAGAWLREHRFHLGAALVVLVAAAAAFTWLRRKRAPAPLQRARRRRRDPVLALYGKTAALVARRAAPRRPGQTPREHARAVAAAGSPAAAPFAELTELYYRARFERDDLAGAEPPELSRARTLAEAVRDALRARPPRAR